MSNQHSVVDKAGAARRVPTRLIDNVGLTLEAFIGEARLTVADLSALGAGGVVPLNAAFNRAVELRLNGATIAHGELVAVDEKFGVRITELAE